MNYPIEQKTKDESTNLERLWDQGAFHFLLSRTQNHFFRKSNSERRTAIQDLQEIHFPLVTDEILQDLYKEACRRYRDKCQRSYLYTGFNQTTAEKDFQKNLLEALEGIPGARFIEVYPSASRSKMIDSGLKPVIGGYVPDILIFGMKRRGFSSIILEVDGECHVDKSTKDMNYYKHMQDLGILVLSIPNELSKDIDHLNALLRDIIKRRSGSFDNQIRTNKRNIWVKTIACHMTLSEIERFVFNKYSLHLHLKKELKGCLVLKNCPRNIRKEALSCIL